MADGSFRQDSEPAQNIPHTETTPAINDLIMQDSPEPSADIDFRVEYVSTEDEAADTDITDDSSVEDEDDHVRVRGLPLASLPTGLCYDERMRYHAEIAATTGESVHPEDPRRIYYIYKELCEAGLVAGESKYGPLVQVPLLRIDAREATREECCLVHTQRHYEFVRKTSEMSNAELIDLSEEPKMDSIYFNSLTYYSSKLSAGAAIETCKAVVDRKVKNAIAVIRPPGHHAEIDKTMGFCLFNNVCIASRVCQDYFREKCRKILILDWDVHHGNGCQNAFYDDPNILYISLHVHMNGGFYPQGNEGDMKHCGRGLGLGKNVNIPWPTKGMGDGDYIYAFQHVVMPIATEFDPDFVIVAAGFDAAAGDELGGCFVTPPCYAHMTHMLMSLAGGKIAVCLEGGYNFTAISRSALAVTKTLMGEPPDRLDATQATPTAVETVEKIKRIQSQYWRSIHPKEPVAGIFGGEKLHDIIREWQAMHLYDKFKMQKLNVFRESISKSFDHQILASQQYEDKKRLFVFFHDAPDMHQSTTTTSTRAKPHETWLVDGTQSYNKWAIEKNFGVIDVNIPEEITMVDPTNDSYSRIEYASVQTDQARKEGEKLASYLWENYIEPYEFPRGIVLVGAGHAFHAVAKLISENDNVYPRVAAVVAFIARNPVRPISNSNNAWMPQWYRENSRVFVSRTHSLWAKEGKVSKRYGRLIKSDGEILHDMLKLHEDEVFNWLTEHIGLDQDTEEEEEEAQIEDSVLSNGSVVVPDIELDTEMDSTAPHRPEDSTVKSVESSMVTER